MAEARYTHRGIALPTLCQTHALTQLSALPKAQTPRKLIDTVDIAPAELLTSLLLLKTLAVILRITSPIVVAAVNLLAPVLLNILRDHVGVLPLGGVLEGVKAEGLVAVSQMGAEFGDAVGGLEVVGDLLAGGGGVGHVLDEAGFEVGVAGEEALDAVFGFFVDVFGLEVAGLVVQAAGLEI